MKLTAYSLKPIRHTLLDDAPCVTRSQIDDDDMIPAVFHPRGVGRGCKDAEASTTTHRPRRFSDPVSDLNAAVHDRARLLARTVEMVDRLGLKIMTVEADRSRNSRIVVMHAPECDALEGVEVARQGGYSHWAATRFGVEIRWCIPMEVA